MSLSPVLRWLTEKSFSVRDFLADSYHFLPVILILTAGFGDGHNTAARNVAQALQRLRPSQEAKVVDVFDIAHPYLSPVMKQNYQMLITRAPSVWAWVYRSAAKVSFDGSPDILAGLRKAIEQLLIDHRPSAIVCSYPVYPKIIRGLKEKLGSIPPIYTVITDSISIHPIWMIAPSDGYFVADEESRQSAIALGAPANLVYAAGFPVNLDFIQQPIPAECESPHGRILYLPSTGLSHVAKTLDAIKPLIRSGVKLTLPVGKHASRLHHVITRYLDSLPGADIEILGWTNRIPRLLQTHDLVICKAGGAILHEALAATCPAVIDYVVPGQEEGNAELLTKNDCGVVTTSPRQTGEQAARLLASNRSVAKSMKRNMRELSEPDAALKIGRQVLDLARL